MNMQDRAKANHYLGKDSKIYHVLGKGSMIANAFFGKFCTQPVAILLDISLRFMVATRYITNQFHGSKCLLRYFECEL